MSKPSLPVDSLPIDADLPSLMDAMRAHNRVVLTAPPGSGKTTRVPLALMEMVELAGRKIILLEPRRVAARYAARRMAAQIGEPVGGTIGYRTALDTRVGPKTRVEVVTEGVLARMVRRDPELTGVGAILFDEFHERSLQADHGLVLARDIQDALREDLRLLIMSATIDADALGEALGAPVIASSGRQFPVETLYHHDTPGLTAMAGAIVDVVETALTQDQGGLLVFLPGQREIGQVRRLLGSLKIPSGVDIHILSGSQSASAQDAAIDPAPEGRRKIVLATAIAETSLTIEDIRVVIDSGWARQSVFDSRTGLSGLETVRVDRHSADQRRGRAGRVAAGRCYRLWTQAAEGGFPENRQPEILTSDLTGVVLDLAAFGVAEPGSLPWLDTPPDAAIDHARALLRRLEALDADGRITEHGRKLASLSLEPRLAHMVVRSREQGALATAAVIAALTSERDILAGSGGARQTDMRERVRLVAAGLAGERTRLDREPGFDRVKRLAGEIWRHAGGRGKLPAASIEVEETGACLALAFPDRVARVRGQAGRYILSGGQGAALADDDSLAGERFLAIAEIDRRSGDGRVFQAAPVSRQRIETLFADQIELRTRCEWDDAADEVKAVERRAFGAVDLDRRPGRAVPRDDALPVLLGQVRRRGVAVLPWTKAAERLRRRVAFARTLDLSPGHWPDWSDQALLDGLEDWLAPYLTEGRRWKEIEALPLDRMLLDRLDWSQRQALDAELPETITVPSGSRIPVQYPDSASADPHPVLQVKLQEVFGLHETPRVAGDRIPVTLHLLSPAGQPMQVTQDLRSFWETGYAAVRADLRGRYPRHPWPDDPLTAEPTRRTKPRTR